MRLLTVVASAAKQSRSLSADAFLDCFAALTMTEETAESLKVFCPTAQAVFRFRRNVSSYENNPMHSRAGVDFKGEFVGWVSESVTHLFALHADVEVVGYAQRFALRAIRYATESPYSAAICLGAGGGFARSAASWA
ncbi:hypothetical protein KUL72_16235 [Bradyrhizobium arachidis]|uniref:hypothetical protein n=1 Tax=Bradyrhizobium arachidis TaxID=858423 RepID=UPI00216321E8|nr:hypothetical protein [Bradyrhizobium arachidis]UVO39793.1 hypothetical protein KUL72_16235 [Bradyrhizobium arachidis]